MLRNRQKYSGNKSKLLWGFFRTAFFGLWFTTLIKLQIIYLSSDAKDFVSWLFNNARSALGGGDQNSWLDNNSVSLFTTFLMMTVIIAITGFCLAEISGAYDRSSQYNLARFTMIAIIFRFLFSAFCFNLLLAGQTVGCSTLVAITAVVSCCTALGPRLKNLGGLMGQA